MRVEKRVFIFGVILGLANAYAVDDAGMSVEVSVVPAEIFAAAGKGDMSKVSGLLKATPRFNVHAKDEYGRTLLMYAVANGALRMVKVLLAKGADVNEKDKDGRTALLAAIAGKNLDIFKLLLAKGAEINVCADTGMTPLMLAVGIQNETMVKALLKKNVFVNFKNKAGQTALDIAKGLKSAKIITMIEEYLEQVQSRKEALQKQLKEQTDAQVKHFIGQYNAWCEEIPSNESREIFQKRIQGIIIPLIPSIKQMLLGIVKYEQVDLLRELLAANEAKSSEGRDFIDFSLEFDQNQRGLSFFNLPLDSRGDTALMKAASLSNSDMVNVLINECCVNVNLTNAQNKTADMLTSNQQIVDAIRNVRRSSSGENLAKAAADNNARMVKVLLGQGINVNFQHKTNGNTPLINAARSGNHGIVRILLAWGANVNIRNAGGETALVCAQKNQHLQRGGVQYSQIIEMLLARGAETNSDRDQLFQAVRFGYSIVVERLLARGVDVNYIDKEGCTALMWAVWNDFSWIVEMLLGVKGIDLDVKDRSGETALVYAFKRNLPDLAEKLLAKGADVNVGGWDNHSALIWAVGKNYPRVVGVLLARGADVNTKNEHGETVLALAVQKGWSDVVEVLLDRGADVNTRNEQGETVLMLAVRKFSSGVVRVLLDRGADVTARDKRGYTALILATLYKFTDIGALLKDKGATLTAQDQTVAAQAEHEAWFVAEMEEQAQIRKRKYFDYYSNY